MCYLCRPPYHDDDLESISSTASSSGPITPPDYEDLDIDIENMFMFPSFRDIKPTAPIIPSKKAPSLSKKPSLLTALPRRTISTPVLSKVYVHSTYQDATMQLDGTLDNALVIV